MNVSESIRAVIETEGPITFAEFMELALYGPGGFYEQPPVGEKGHFVTSPHVHPIFGHLVGVAIEGLWAVTGERLPLRLLEVGAGDGTLAKQIIETLAELPIEYTAAERSPGARERLSELGLRVVEDIGEEIQPFTGCVISNELLDNLPFHRVRGTENGAVELRVGFEQDSFVEVEAQCPKDLAVACPVLAPGDETVVSLAAIEFIERLSQILLDGYALLIDYGNGRAGDAHGYRAQRVVTDVIGAPGTTDITAGVNFAFIREQAEALGFQVFGPVSQKAALEALGFRTWAATQRVRQRSLLADGAGAEAVKAWSDRNKASLLVDPAALGALRWLVLATPGLPQPPWTARQPS